MTKFSGRLGKTEKVDNHQRSFGDKVEIRRNLLAAVGLKVGVLDCFAGSGKMHAAVWKDAASYVACDERFFFDKRTAFVCDNRLMLRTLDLSRFSIFDLDAYGSPWEQAFIIASRRSVANGERIGFAITEGSGLKLKFGGLPIALAKLAGVPVNAAGAFKARADIVDAALAGMAAMMKCKIEKRWQAERAQGSAMLYIGVVLRSEG